MTRWHVAFIVLMAADAATTTIALGMGGIEADPLVARVLIFGMIGLWLLKLCQVIAVIGLVTWRDKTGWLVPLTGLMTLVVAWNAAQIVGVA